MVERVGEGLGRVGGLWSVERVRALIGGCRVSVSGGRRETVRGLSRAILETVAGVFRDSTIDARAGSRSRALRLFVTPGALAVS